MTESLGNAIERRAEQAERRTDQALAAEKL